MHDTQDISMEIHHGRKGTAWSFKGVICKVLVGTVVLSSVLSGFTTNAIAADESKEARVISHQYSVSLNDAVASIRNTISRIEAEKANGNVSDEMLSSLSDKILDLDRTVTVNELTVDITDVLNSAENAVKDVKGSEADGVRSAISTMKILYLSNKVENKTLSFSDVEPGTWYYEAVMKMTEMELFSGTTVPVNGVGTFNPNGTMTRAEFITTCVRYLDRNVEQGGEYWYSNFVDKALEIGLIHDYDFSDDYNSPCTREEMAYIVVNMALMNGEKASKLVGRLEIPDNFEIDSYYRWYVKQAMLFGIIAGTTEQHHFSAKSTMTRAQGATVLYRLLFPEQRTPVATEPIDTNYQYYNNYKADLDREPVTWVEGERHPIPIAGDTVIRKSDGKPIRIDATCDGKGEHLGLLQGVDIWSGTERYIPQTGKTSVTSEGSASWFKSEVSEFTFNELRTEMHSHQDWVKIEELSFPGRDKKGAYDGEITPDGMWKWNQPNERWEWIGG